MRILHVIKTVDGAKWAVDQVRELIKHGIEIHVALPSLEGRLIDAWRSTGATLHSVGLDFPSRNPWRLKAVCQDARALVAHINPDIIHSHFFGTTMVLRHALGSNHPIPRIFQVPGPLHLEHSLFRHWDLLSASKNDFWVASSRYIRQLYLESGISSDRLFLSYYGNRITDNDAPASGVIRRRFGIPSDNTLVGNINYMYPPKYYLGQTRGVKCHEDLIDALGILLQKRNNVTGLLIGGQWGHHDWYENRLRRRAAKIGGGNILLPGPLPPNEAPLAWHDFDIAVHTPQSENCGGVVEPLAAEVPVIASNTGGLPEVIIDGITGKLVPQSDPDALAKAIEDAINNIEQYNCMAKSGGRLVRHMFDAKRTAGEIRQIYDYLLGASAARPGEFDSRQFVAGSATSIP